MEPAYYPTGHKNGNDQIYQLSSYASTMQYNGPHVLQLPLQEYGLNVPMRGESNVIRSYEQLNEDETNIDVAQEVERGSETLQPLKQLFCNVVETGQELLFGLESQLPMVENAISHDNSMAVTHLYDYPVNYTEDSSAEVPHSENAQTYDIAYSNNNSNSTYTVVSDGGASGNYSNDSNDDRRRLESFWEEVPLFKSICLDPKFDINRYKNILMAFERRMVEEYYFKLTQPPSAVSPLAYQQENQIFDTQNEMPFDVYGYTNENKVNPAGVSFKNEYAELGVDNEVTNDVGNYEIHDNQPLSKNTKARRSLSPNALVLKKLRKLAPVAPTSISNTVKVQEQKIKDYFNGVLPSNFLDEFKKKKFYTSVVIFDKGTQTIELEISGNDLTALFTKGRMNCVVNAILKGAFLDKIPYWYLKTKGSDKKKIKISKEDLCIIKNSYINLLNGIIEFIEIFNIKNGTKIGLPRNYTNVDSINWQLIVSTRARVIRFKIKPRK